MPRAARRLPDYASVDSYRETLARHLADQHRDEHHQRVVISVLEQSDTPLSIEELHDRLPVKLSYFELIDALRGLQVEGAIEVLPAEGDHVRVLEDFEQPVEA